jgi:hypothetical protein
MKITLSNLTKPFKSIPGPKEFPFIGNLLATKNYGGELDLQDVPQFYFDLQKKYGNIVKTNFGLFSKSEVFYHSSSQYIIKS